MTIAHEVLLRQVPPELADAVHAGAIKLFGSILRDPVTGRIAGFLQETGAAPKLAEALHGGVSLLDATPGAAMRVADLGMGAAGLVQGEQIKAQLRLVSQLQIGICCLPGRGSAYRSPGLQSWQPRSMRSAARSTAWSIGSMRSPAVSRHFATIASGNIWPN